MLKLSEVCKFIERKSQYIDKKTQKHNYQVFKSRQQLKKINVKNTVVYTHVNSDTQ